MPRTKEKKLLQIGLLVPWTIAPDPVDPVLKDLMLITNT